MVRSNNLLSILRLLFSKSPGQKRYFFLVIFTIALTAVLSALFPILFAKGIDALGATDVSKSNGLRFIVAFGISMLVVSLLEQLQWLTFGPLNLLIQRHLTIFTFERTVKLPFYKLKDLNTYEISRSIERGLGAVREIASNLAFFIIPSFIELVIAAFVIAIIIDIWTAIILVLALTLYGYLTNKAASSISETTEMAMYSGQDAWAFGLDGVVNAELLQQANAVEGYRSRLQRHLEEADVFWSKTFRQRTFYGLTQSFVFGVVVIYVLWRGASDVISGTLSLGDLVLLNTYIIRLLQPIETFARVYQEVRASLAEAKLLEDLISIPEIDTRHQLSDNRNSPLKISLDDVSLGFNENVLFESLSFELPKGKLLYVVGSSGSGKSSLLRLLSCLTEPDSGTYMIDDDAVSQDLLPYFRKHIAVVQQTTLLFDWTISDNIKFGIDVDDADLNAIIERLGLSYISAGDTGGDHLTVGERGERLSGGERQRVALARAFLRKPLLLLLDEPTASLDQKNKSEVLSIISEIGKKATVIHVTHDTSLINNDNLVLFLRKDETPCFGRHANLLNDQKSYAAFCDIKSNRNRLR